MRTEEKLVTPEMAELWLTKNKRNRAINSKRVDSYAQEIQAGNWYLHHQGIGFYEDGSLADGQHRLAGVVKAGVAVKMLVSWGIPDESGLMIDGHQQRRAHQSIKISGLADWVGKDEVSIARSMIIIGSPKDIGNRATLTGIINYCEAHKQSIMFAVDATAQQRRLITNAKLRAAVACAWYYENPDRLREFCAVMTTGMAQGERDKAAIMAREWMISDRAASVGAGAAFGAVKRIMRAIKAFCEGQEISKLYQPSDFIYIPPTSELADSAENLCKVQ